MSLIRNHKASYEFELGEKYQAGVVLTGGEVKSVRLGKGSLAGSFVKVIGDEVYLLNAQINPYQFADNRDYDPKRTRKLLLSRREITELITANQRKGVSLVPLAFFVAHNRIKLEFALGRGKKQFEKRAALKRKATERDVARSFKDKVHLR